MPWWKDRSLIAAAAVGASIRIAAWAAWPASPCERDECLYLDLAARMAAGEGMTFTEGWLWAPGYPALMAAHRLLTGMGSSVRATQIVAAFASSWLVYWLTLRVSAANGHAAGNEASRRAARIAVWICALSPTAIFFSVSLWSEALYGVLLLCAVAGVQLCSERLAESSGRLRPAAASAAATGAVLGVCVLFRGVATYLLPIFATALLWRRWRLPSARAGAASMVLAALVVVLPYSAYISNKLGVWTISDRTLGRMLYLGNNDFSPVTYDYGSGYLTGPKIRAHLAQGRPECAPRSDPLTLSSCEVDAGIAWILDHPGTFLSRVPLRVAQLANPHSFLTRHLRFDGWPGLPQWIDEGIVLSDAALSILLMSLGVLGLAAYARGPTGVAIVGVLLYHVGVIAALYGISRYRAPLEPLLTIYAALVLADWQRLWATLRSVPRRAACAALALGLLMPLVAWYLPSAWPGWHSW